MPRWPYGSVLLSDLALIRLEEAQARLTPLRLKLVLTRGYEERSPLNRLHGVARLVGSGLFRLLYPRRADERFEIFSPNGHDHGGNAIDVSIVQDGRILSFLPWGVFTPSLTLDKKRREHEPVLAAVWAALTEAGFRIHPNPTEALQIHCDLSEPLH